MIRFFFVGLANDAFAVRNEKKQKMKCRTAENKNRNKKKKGI